MVSSNETRFRLCDSNKRKLPLIKEELRKRVPTPWFALTEKELNRYVIYEVDEYGLYKIRILLES